MREIVHFTTVCIVCTVCMDVLENISCENSQILYRHPDIIWNVH